MEVRHQVTSPIGVGRLMYVGDDADRACCGNQAAINLTKVGLAVAAYGLISGNKKVRNAGLATAALMFIAI